MVKLSAILRVSVRATREQKCFEEEFAKCKARGRLANVPELPEEDIEKMLELGSKGKRMRHMKYLSTVEWRNSYPKPEREPSKPPPLLTAHGDGTLVFNSIIGLRNPDSKLAQQYSRQIFSRITGTNAVVLDCSYFSDPFTDFQKKRLVSREVARCIRTHRRHANPGQLYVSNFELLQPHLDSVKRMLNDGKVPERRDVGLDYDPLEGCVTRHFAKESLVFLTGDAEEELGEVDEEKVYVLGATVSGRSLSLQRARALGIPARRYPLRRQAGIGKEMATILLSQALAILLDVRGHAQWDRALFHRVRKFARRREIAEEEASHPPTPREHNSLAPARQVSAT